MSAIDSADRLLQHIKDLVARSDVAATSSDLQTIHSCVESDLAELDQLFETAAYDRGRIFSGELSSAKSIIDAPPVVVDLAVPRVNRSLLGIVNSFTILGTVESLSLSRIPGNPDTFTYDEMATAFISTAPRL